MHPVLERMAGHLVVSCQAYPGEPMRHPETMAQLAEAAVRGGAAAVRLQGLEDIRLTAGRVDVPVIGLLKEGEEGVCITPTLDLCRAVADAVALDGTTRPRPDGLTLAQTVAAFPDVPVVAEGRIHSPAEAAAAKATGAHAVVVGTAITHPTTITGWFVTAVEEEL